MKNNYKIIILAITLILGTIAIIIKTNNNTNDALKFKTEYESLNNKTNAKGKSYPNVTISKNNIIKYATYEEIKEIITKKSGVIYFGFKECPWCRNIIEPLLKASEQTNLKQIYYFNAHDIRDEKHLDENKNIITDKEGTKEYQELISLIGDKLTPYEGLEDETIKRLYFPTILFIKDGEIVDIHIGTLEEQKDPYNKLTTTEQQTLTNIYKTKIEKTIPTTCNDKC